jgi:hypothetical protein
MIKITAPGLIELFRQTGYFKSSNGVIVTMTGDVVNITMMFDAKGIYKLYDEADSVEDFMAIYKIDHFEDLESLSEAQMWSRYLEQKAEVIFTDKLGNSVNFLKFNSKTQVCCLRLNFYLEVNEVWDEIDQFRVFIEKNWIDVGSILFED